MSKELKAILEGNVNAAILITIGDTDGDGKVGVRAHVFADIPFDGSDVPVGVLTSPEYEPADSGTLVGTVRQAMSWAQNLLGRIPVFPAPNASKRARVRAIAAASSSPVKRKRGRPRKVAQLSPAKPEESKA